MSRAEAQQRTREELLDAAEEEFLANGLNRTTMAKIAAAAGRTQGAIYANFSSKENLCAEVLFRIGMRIFTDISAKILGSSGELEDQVSRLVEMWRIVSENSNLTVLVAEYALAIQKDPEQLRVSMGHIEMGIGMVGVVVSGTRHRRSQEEQDTAVRSIVATVTGLAMSQTMGILDEAKTAELFERTLRLWLEEGQPRAVVAS